MTGRTDIDQALAEWGRDAGARAAATAPTQPRIAELLAEHRSTPRRRRHGSGYLGPKARRNTRTTMGPDIEPLCQP